MATSSPQETLEALRLALEAETGTMKCPKKEGTAYYYEQGELVHWEQVAGVSATQRCLICGGAGQVPRYPELLEVVREKCPEPGFTHTELQRYTELGLTPQMQHCICKGSKVITRN